MANVVEHMQDLGFTEVECRVYLALLERRPQTGYQVARAARVQRPNVYPALERLERRGAVVRVPHPAGAVLYAAVPFEQLARRLDALHREHIEAVRRVIAERPEVDERGGPVLTMTQGNENLLSALQEMVAGANRSLVVGLCPPEAAAVGDHLADAQSRGVQVSVVCLTACGAPCGHCIGDLVRTAIVAGGGRGVRRWAVAIRDGEESLIGEVAPTGEGLALRSRQPVLLAVTAGFLSWAAARDARDPAESFGLPAARGLLADLVQGGVVPAGGLDPTLGG